ncbi:uncharacterized protein LOC133296737 [Gastrolobium bilobum]|uniref:uncharacterized protein LOC133296737 n=1 Tax=Gastrolobium bilobum TaxID=150636 RepID=UPI002AB13889|nr:uncharacterized protein LOC133296737 [Gastrolobium bilobum]
MEAGRRRVLTRRNPLSDCTNTYSSSVPLKPNKPNPSSSAFNKPSPKLTSATNVPTNLDNASNPSSPPLPILSTPSLKTPSLKGNVDPEASKPISILYSRRCSSNKRKYKGKAVAIPVCSTPIMKISDTREKSDGVEGANLRKSKALTVPCIKKQRAVFTDPPLQDFIKEQKAYFKEIDEFELLEEEVKSIDELD